MADKTGIDKLAYTLAAAYLLYLFLPWIGHLGALVLSIIGLIATQMETDKKEKQTQNGSKTG